MASNLIQLVNEYYEARKPYTQMVREAHASLPPRNSFAETNASTAESSSNVVPSQQEPEFSMSPKIPHDEMMDVLKKLEAAKIEYAQREKSTGKASAGKKGKAPVNKK